MKRRRKSAVSKTQMSKKDAEQNQISGPSITDLPSAIVVEILLKLPVKSIVMCKSVCKTWRSLISDPYFVELHLARSKTRILIRNKHNFRFSRSLYLLEPEDVCNPASGYCLCRADSADKCKHFRFNTRMESVLKIPLRKAQVMLDIVKERGDSVAFCVATWSKSEDLIKLKYYDHRYDVANSCNGLLLLSKCRLGLRGIEDFDNPVVVCNPVTGEFIHLIEDCNEGLANDGMIRMNWYAFGLGFSPKHNQYKAIRIAGEWRTHPMGYQCYGVEMAEIHTLGTGLWRNLDFSAIEFGYLSSPAYLDGALHWIFTDSALRNYKLASFDLDEERFQVHSVPSPPPPPRFSVESPKLAITVLGGRLYLYTDVFVTRIVIWVMDGNGVSRSWTELFSVDVSEFRRSSENRQRYQLISCLNNDAMVMFDGGLNEFVYYDQVKGLRFKQLKFQGLASECEAISCAPSFISLKDVVTQGNGKVLNINSGCGNLKLLEETYPLLLRGGKKLDESSNS